MMSTTLVVQGDIAKFCKNSVDKRHLERWCSAFTRARTLGSRAWIAAGKPTILGRARLDLHVVRGSGRLLDEPNIWWGAGGFIDGMCQDALLKDDSPKYLHLGEITQESDPRHKDREYTHFIFTPMEPSLWHGNEPSDVNSHHSAGTAGPPAGLA